VSNKVYFTVCIGYLLAIMGAAICVDDLTLVFGIISGVAESTTVFILPALFYIIATTKLNKQRKGKRTSLYKQVLAGGFGLFGLSYFFLSNYFNFVKLIR